MPFPSAHAATTGFHCAHRQHKMALVMGDGLYYHSDHVSSPGGKVGWPGWTATVTMGGREPGRPRLCTRVWRGVCVCV